MFKMIEVYYEVHYICLKTAAQRQMEEISCYIQSCIILFEDTVVK